MEKARLAVDIGGTFTDLCLEWNGKLTSVKVLTTPRAPEEGVLTGMDRDPEAVGRQARRSRPHHPRHDAGHQRHHRAQGRQDGAGRHRGLPRFDRDRLRASLRAVRHLHGEAAAAGAARPALRHPRAHRRPRQRADPARRGGGDARWRPSSRPPASRRSPSATCTPISTASTSGARATSWPRLLPGVSISLSSEVSPEIREYERWSTAVANAYVQPVMDRYLGRLDAALRAAAASPARCS